MCGDGLDDADVAFRRPCGAADEKAVDRRLFGELPAIAGVHAAAIDDIDLPAEAIGGDLLDAAVLDLDEAGLGGVPPSPIDQTGS